MINRNAVPVPQGFIVTNNDPIDARMQLSSAEMLEISSKEYEKRYFPDYYIVQRVDAGSPLNGRPYFFSVTNTFDSETGKFKLMPSSTSYKDLDDLPTLNGHDFLGDMLDSELDLQHILLPLEPVFIDDDSQIGLYLDADSLFVNSEGELEVRFKKVEELLDSEHKWNLEQHTEIRQEMSEGFEELTFMINSEEARRIAADSELGERIDSETAARLKADSELLAHIDSEVERLTEYIDSEIVELKNVIDSELEELKGAMDSELAKKQDILTQDKNASGPIRIDMGSEGPVISVAMGDSLTLNADEKLIVKVDDARAAGEGTDGIFVKIDNDTIIYNAGGEIENRIKLPDPKLSPEGYQQAIVSHDNGDGTFSYVLGDAGKVDDVLVAEVASHGGTHSVVTDKVATINLTDYEFWDNKLDEVRTADKITDHSKYPSEYAVRELFNKLSAGNGIDKAVFKPEENLGQINVKYDNKSIKLTTANEIYSADVDLSAAITHAAGTPVYLTDIVPADTAADNQLVNESGLATELQKFTAGEAIDATKFDVAAGKTEINVLYDDKTIKLTAADKKLYAADVDLTGDAAGADITLRDIVPSAAGKRADGTYNELVDMDTLQTKLNESLGKYKGTYEGATIAEAEGQLPTVDVGNNDYANLLIKDAAGDFSYMRYKYIIDAKAGKAGWEYEYTYQHTFSTDQWNAINSGVAPGNWQKKIIEGANVNFGTDGATLNVVNTTYKAGNGVDISPDTTVTDINNPVFIVSSTLTASQGIKIDGKDIQHTNVVAGSTAGVGSGRKALTVKYDTNGHITETTTTDMYPPLTSGSAGQLYMSTGTDGQWTNPARTMTANQMETPSSQAVIDYLKDNYFATPGSGLTPSLSSGNNVMTADLATGKITAIDTKYECNQAAVYNSNPEVIITAKAGTADPNPVFELKLNNHMYGGTDAPLNSFGVDGDIFIQFK